MPPQLALDGLAGASWRIYQDMFPKLMRIYVEFLKKLALAAIPGVVAVLILAFAQSNGFTGLPLDLTYFALGAIYLVVLVRTALWWELSLLYAVLTREHQPAGRSVANIIDDTEPQIWKFFWVGLVAGVVTMLWSLLLIVPGVIFGLYYSLAEYVFADTGKRPLDVMRLSRAYIKGYWWRTAAAFLVLGLISLLVYMVALIVEVVAGDVAGPIAMTVINLIFVPYTVIYMGLLYERFKQLKPQLHTTS